MKIEIISVSAVSDGAEILLTLKLSSDDGKSEKRKILLFTEQYLELGLSRGAAIEQDAYDELEQLSKKCMAIRKGSNLLSYSAASKVRLAQKLRSKGIDRENAISASEQLEKIGLINEEADVERLVQSCLNKLWGKKRIYRELCAKGYERDVVRAELEKIDDGILVDNCVALFRRKHKKWDTDPDTQKKMIASLVRYGYSFNEIKQALQEIEK